jgi:hypothetical protein
VKATNEEIRFGLWHSQGLTSTEKMVALCVVHYRDGEHSNTSQRYIARRTGFSLRTVNSALASLQRKSILAIWPGKNDFCRYEFNDPLFVLNSAQLSRTPPAPKPIKFSADDGCIPAWEATKPKVDDYPPEDEMAKSDFDELVRIHRLLPKPEPIKPWPLNTDVLTANIRDDSSRDPDELSTADWKRHEMMAELLMGIDERKAVA